MSVRIVFKQVSLYPKSVRHFSSMRLSPRSFHGKNNGIKSTTPTFHFLRKSLSVSQIKLFSGHGKPPVDTIEEEIHGTKVTFERQDPDDDDNNDAVEVPEIDTSKYTHEVVTKMPDDFEGKIVEWYKEEGDIINRGDIICDVDTAVRKINRSIYVLY